MKNYFVITFMAIFLSLVNVPFASSNTNNLPECCKNKEACCGEGAACCPNGKTEKTPECCGENLSCCQAGASCCANSREDNVSKRANKKAHSKGANSLFKIK